MPNQRLGILITKPVTKEIKSKNVTAQFGLHQIIKEPTHISNT